MDRTYWWGPGPYTQGMMEEYEQSPGNERLVQYFDKSRMEINNPNGDPDELWYVTNGLLVVEMVEGKIQIGDGEFRDAEPANVPVAGDPDNPYGPTYATLAQRLDDPALDQNVLVADRIDRDGNVTYDPALNDYEIGIGTYVEETDHSVAAPFWNIMNETGTIYVDGELTNGPIFRNPFYAVGYPITEPYWSTAVVAGAEQDVLLQCFERRCLTYTPGNELGFQVEAGNVGQHYYRWRYGDGGQEPETETVNVFLVAIGDNGESGQLIGCEDSLIPVEMNIEATSDTATRVERALMALFGIDEQNYGQSGLYNSLYQSNLSVDSVTMNGSEATVDISGEISIGGVCDEPRFEEQIRQTVLDIDGVDTAMITVNGTPLDELFGGPGDGDGDQTETTQIYLVAVGDNGESGQMIGCGDSLVPVDVQIDMTEDTATRVERTLTELFGIDEQYYGQSGLYNALYQSNLSVSSVTMNDGEAVVELSGSSQIGGTCDEPRFEEQIRQTVLGIDGVDSATITLNGTPLDEVYGGPGDGDGDQMEDTAEIFFVVLGGNGEGSTFGCGDSLAMVETMIEPTDDRATQIERSLEALFAVNSETYEDTDLYNALYQSSLTVDSVSLTGNVAYISLSGEVAVGGTCDEPRFERQIRQTALSLSSIDEVNIMLNGEPLDEYFGPDGETETVNIYFVAIGDNGENGRMIGCQDSLVPVEVEIDATDDSGVRVLEALNALIETDDATVEGPNGMEVDNALAESDVGAIAADVESGLATVHMGGDVSVGGTCDEPRFVEQIRATVLQFDSVRMANVFLNDELLRGYFGPESMDEGVLATFSVSGELFNLWSTNEDTIDQLMALDAGESNATIPNGPILRDSGTANHNAPWSWHLDPSMTEMAELTVEVCDGSPSFVEENVDYFVDQVGQYCPWNAELIHLEDLTTDESS
ncbi:MAG: GerMN domain-containing protein [Thermomicrobiales bacterium]